MLRAIGSPKDQGYQDLSPNSRNRIHNRRSPSIRSPNSNRSPFSTSPPHHSLDEEIEVVDDDSIHDNDDAGGEKDASNKPKIRKQLGKNEEIEMPQKIKSSKNAQASRTKREGKEKDFIAEFHRVASAEGLSMTSREILTAHELLYLIKHKFHNFWHSAHKYAKLHFLFYSLTAVVFTFILWGIEYHNNAGLNFWNAFIISCGSMTGAGLSPVDYSQLRTLTQLCSMFLMIIGSQAFLMIPCVFVVRSNCEDKLVRRTLARLMWVIFFYVFFILLVGGFALSVYLLGEPQHKQLDGLNPWYWGYFTAASAYGNTGYTLFADNLVRYATDKYINIVLMLIIIFSYTALPIGLRFAIYISKFVCYEKKTSHILLHAPPFSGHLLPGLEARLLAIFLLITITLGAAQILVFEFHGTLAPFNFGDKVLVSLFNDVSTRNAGFNTINFGNNRDLVNLIVIFYMYIGGYPFGVRLVRTLYPKGATGGVGFYLFKFLRDPKIWLCFGLILICIGENDQLGNDNNPNFTFFKVLFEVISAYGGVGLTLGVPNSVIAFCGLWTPFAKVILGIIMIIGRHRSISGLFETSIQEANNLSDIAEQDNEMREVQV